MVSIRIGDKQCYGLSMSSSFLAVLAGTNGKGDTINLYLIDEESCNCVSTFKTYDHSSSISWYYGQPQSLVLTTQDGHIDNWSINNDEITLWSRLPKMEHNFCVGCHKTLPLIVSGSYNNSVRLWDSYRSVKFYQTNVCDSPNFVTSLCCKDTTFMATTSKGGIVLWDLRCSDPIFYAQDQWMITSGTFSCDGSFIATSNMNDEIHVRDLRCHPARKLTLHGHNAPVRKCLFSPHKQELLASISYDNSTKIWDVRQATVMETIFQNSGTLTGLDFNDDVPYEIAVCGKDSLVHVFTPDTLINMDDPVSRL